MPNLLGIDLCDILFSPQTVETNEFSFIKKERYEEGDIIVVTNDEDKLRNIGYSSTGIESFLGKTGTILSCPYNDRYNSSISSSYYLLHDAILGLWNEKYTAPPKQNKITCPLCYDKFLQDTENKDETLCPECSKRHLVLPYHKYQPKLKFYGQSNKNKNPYLGIELEVDEGGESNYNVKKIMPIMNKEEKKHFIYCSHDSSIDNGFEIITQPATLRYHLSIMEDYSNMFKELVKMGYQSHNTSTCGIHVHFNRDFYSENETLYITRLLYLIEKFWEEVVVFSRRDMRKMDKYSKKIDCCIEDYIEQWDKTGRHDAHYYAINLTNLNTIEFRMFRGTLNLNSFRAILEFVNSCIKIAKNKTTEEIQRMNFTDILTPFTKKYYQSRVAAYDFEE